MNFNIVVAAVATLAGAVASVAGFGIGSLLTPLLSLKMDLRIAVAAVSIPHFIATLWRCWMLRRDIDKQLLWKFGIASALGGLLGALAHTVINTSALTMTFALVLTLVGLLGITGLSSRLRFHGPVAFFAGAVSGALGGLVGNQGGIRSAALLGFELNKNAFVATATAVGLIVDIVRMPVYLAIEADQLKAICPIIVIACAGAIAGTGLGMHVLKNIPEQAFKKIVSGVILALGAWLLH